MRFVLTLTMGLLVWLTAPSILGAQVVADQPSIFDESFGGLASRGFALRWLDDPESLPTVDPIEVIRAQTENAGSGNLAAKSQNPVSDLASVPIQNNFDFGFDPGNRMRYVGNVQPVVPLKLNDDWNLIARLIVPLSNVPVGAIQRSDGLGDSVGQFFFSPSDTGSFTWGIGPSILFPTASDGTLGFQEWGAGVSAVGLITEGPIVAGMLINQMYSFEGTTKPFLIQPFFNYNLPEGWFVNLTGEANADWEQPDERRWSFVLGPGLGRVFQLFGQPLNVSARFAPYLEKPTGGPDWQFRLAVAMLFPR